MEHDAQRWLTVPRLSFCEFGKWRIFNAPSRGTAASDHLDMMRGLAAVAVLIFHTRGTFFVDSGRSPGHSALTLFYFVTGLGHQAVMVFFVLSGLLVGSSVLRARLQERWSWRTYLTARLTRLYVVLIPALILGLLWDRVGIALFGTEGIYSGAVANASIAYRVAPRLSPTIMLGNAAFLQGILVPCLGSNGPLWSLSYEFWYYVMFPLLVCTLWPGTTRRARALSALAMLAVMAGVGWNISRYFLIWLMGAGLNLVPRLGSDKRRRLIGAGLLLFPVALALSYARLGILHHSYPNDLVVGASAAALIYALLHVRAQSVSGWYSCTAGELAGFSYTLYLAQLPVLVFLKALILPHSRWNVGAGSFAAYLAIIAVVTAYAWFVARSTEARTDVVRRRVSALLASPKALGA